MPTFKDGSSLADSNKTQKIHKEYSRARSYAFTQVLYWTGTLIFLHAVGNSLSRTMLRNIAAMGTSRRPQLQSTVLRPQADSEVNAVASSLLGGATRLSQALDIPPVFLMLTSSPKAMQLWRLREDKHSAEQHLEREEGLQWVWEMLAAILLIPLIELKMFSFASPPPQEKDGKWDPSWHASQWKICTNMPHEKWKAWTQHSPCLF